MCTFGDLKGRGSEVGLAMYSCVHSFKRMTKIKRRRKTRDKVGWGGGRERKWGREGEEVGEGRIRKREGGGKGKEAHRSHQVRVEAASQATGIRHQRLTLSSGSILGANLLRGAKVLYSDGSVGSGEWKTKGVGVDTNKGKEWNREADLSKWAKESIGTGTMEAL